MASLQQKRPSISNWFSSLRRQPKNKRTSNSVVYGTEKPYQRSCIDLSASTFYIPQSTTTTGNGTGHLSKSSLVDGECKAKAKLCIRCCSTILPTKAESQISPSTPTVNDLSTSNTNGKSSAKPPLPKSLSSPRQETNFTPTGTTATITSSITFETEQRKNMETVRLASVDSSSLPSSPSTPTTPIHIINKTTEFKRVSTTKTTKTIVTSRPVELLLNEKGEIILKRPKSLEKSTRSSSLGCVLDDEQNDQFDESPSICDSPRTLALNGIDTDLKFIDDSSTSQSENERNSQQSCLGIADKENFLSKSYANPDSIKFCTTPRSMSLSTPNNDSNRGSRKQRFKAGLKYNDNYNNNNNNNNNVDDLCDDCRNVIERNLNNRLKQQQLKQQKYANAVIYPDIKQIKDELCEVVSEMEALDVPEDCKHSNKDKQMSIGRKKFNMDPKKGIEYLVENRLLRHDPQDVAHFLYKGEGLNKTAIGDYLGENNDFNKDVLKAFVALHDFTNLILVQALRQFLWSFRLPGEAQKIDRMMECFAQRYCQLNPDIFTNTDTCYVLSFAIIMLNTSLHNPSVKDKPTVEQFISMNRGINNGGDLPRTLLESLYESIRTEPFKIPQDDGNDLMHTFFNPDKEGWLWKQGGRYKSWKRRWFILNDNCLYYFEYTTDKEPRGIIPLENISVREIHDRSKPNCFELFATGGADIIKACKTDSEGKVVEGKHTVYRMSAATEEEQQEWIKRLTQSISHNPFYDILVQRKKKALSKS
ncbi:cytohesin steppke isoform 1-T5 [Glossina fuscipes fuscipes]